MNIKQVENIRRSPARSSNYRCNPSKGATPRFPWAAAALACHVIPVEQAIPAETKQPPTNNCPTGSRNTTSLPSRLLLPRYAPPDGEGCGHLKKTCASLSRCGRICVSSGRAHTITYEECLDILKKAEDTALCIRLPMLTGLKRFSAYATAAAVPASACAHRSF